MKSLNLNKTLSQLSTIQKQINKLPMGEEGVVELKCCIRYAHHLAKTLDLPLTNADSYYRSHLLYLLLSNVNELELYGTYQDEAHQSLLFNRCQRYAVSGIGELVQCYQNT